MYDPSRSLAIGSREARDGGPLPEIQNRSMSTTIFFSWQTDWPTKEGRNFIERARQAATERISKDLQIDEPDARASKSTSRYWATGSVRQPSISTMRAESHPTRPSGIWRRRTLPRSISIRLPAAPEWSAANSGAARPMARR